jgi:hypothetical protein
MGATGETSYRVLVADPKTEAADARNEGTWLSVPPPVVLVSLYPSERRPVHVVLLVPRSLVTTG